MQQVAKQIILQPVEALIPYARNSRTHSDEQVAQIAASIREFGFTNPVLVDDDGGIVAGHGRVMAARQIGMTAVPTINVGWLSEQQRRAYVIADNQLAMNAGWDESVLAQEVAWLQDHQFNTDLLGFNADYLDGLLAEEQHNKLTDPTDQHEWMMSSLTRSQGAISAKLSGGLAFLATVGSTSPFVGLLGMVVGVINAFVGIASGWSHATATTSPTSIPSWANSPTICPSCPVFPAEEENALRTKVPCVFVFQPQTTRCPSGEAPTHVTTWKPSPVLAYPGRL